jgi:hypothetical protein
MALGDALRQFFEQDCGHGAKRHQSTIDQIINQELIDAAAGPPTFAA